MHERSVRADDVHVRQRVSRRLLCGRGLLWDPRQLHGGLRLTGASARTRRDPVARAVYVALFPSEMLYTPLPVATDTSG